MSTHDEQPPRLATLLLRLSCKPARREEIEGDLHELYQRRLARSGDRHARMCYVVDVLDLCVRQVLSRAFRAGQSPVQIGAVRVYWLRIFLWSALWFAGIAALGLVVPSDRPWGRNAREALSFLASVVEMWFWISLGSAKRVGEPEPD